MTREGEGLFRALQHEQFSRDGLERWPLCRDIPVLVLFTKIVQNGFIEGKEEIILHMALASPGVGCYILMKDRQGIYQYLLFFQADSYYMGFPLPKGIPKGRMCCEFDKFQKQSMYCKWDKMKVNRVISLTKLLTLEESLRLYIITLINEN